MTYLNIREPAEGMFLGGREAWALWKAHYFSQRCSGERLSPPQNCRGLQWDTLSGGWLGVLLQKTPELVLLGSQANSCASSSWSALSPWAKFPAGDRDITSTDGSLHQEDGTCCGRKSEDTDHRANEWARFALCHNTESSSDSRTRKGRRDHPCAISSSSSVLKPHQHFGQG